MESAFGVNHGEEISKDNRGFLKDIKNEKHATTGRHLAGGAFPGYHAAFAGKKGKKLRAAGHEILGATIGSTVPGPGTVLGGIAGTEIAARKGYYKKQKKGAF